MGDKEYIKDKIRKHVALVEAVEEVVESAEPIYSGSDSTVLEYVIDADAYDVMFACMTEIKQKEDNGLRVEPGATGSIQ